MSQLDLGWPGHAWDESPEHQLSPAALRPDGVCLARLLELTRPTPVQAVVVGLGVVSSVRARHGAGYSHGSVSPGEVRIGADGQVRLGWTAGALSGSEEAPDRRQRADIAALGVLLADLAKAARSWLPSTDESTLVLLAALDAAVDQAAHPGAGIELVAEPLRAACGPDQDAAARSELAALVSAITGSGSAPTLPLPQSARPAQSVRTAQSPPAGSSRESSAVRLSSGLRRVWQRTWTWLVALAVLAGAVSLEFIVLHDRLTQDVHLLLGGGQPGQGTNSPAEPTSVALPPVPTPAPASAGIVNGVDLRALQPCTPGAVCAVRVLVRLQPQPQPQAVTWTVQVVDRCTGSQHNVPGGVVSVPPGGDQAQAVSTVPLPLGQGLVVMAVTSEPASAASRPLPVTARQDSC